MCLHLNHIHCLPLLLVLVPSEILRPIECVLSLKWWKWSLPSHLISSCVFAARFFLPSSYRTSLGSQRYAELPKHLPVVYHSIFPPHIASCRFLVATVVWYVLYRLFLPCILGALSLTCRCLFASFGLIHALES